MSEIAEITEGMEIESLISELFRSSKNLAGQKKQKKIKNQIKKINVFASISSTIKN